MPYRFLASLGLLAIVLAAPLPSQVSAKAKKTVPRATDGHPDLQGTWTNATLTPMERPAELAGKATLSDDEARAYEKKDLETNDIDKPDAPLVGARRVRRNWRV